MEWIGLASNALESIAYHWVPVHGRTPSRDKRKGAPGVFTAIRSAPPIIRRLEPSPNAITANQRMGAHRERNANQPIDRYPALLLTLRSSVFIVSSPEGEAAAGDGRGRLLTPARQTDPPLATSSLLWTPSTQRRSSLGQQAGADQHQADYDQGYVDRYQSPPTRAEGIVQETWHRRQAKPEPQA